MGMFDFVRCEYPLPGLDDPTSIEFHTYEMPDPDMGNYVITAGGRLTKFFSDDDGEGHEDLGYDDDFHFHGYRKIPPKEPLLGIDPTRVAPEELFEYVVRFTEGVVTRVKRIGTVPQG